MRSGIQIALCGVLFALCMSHSFPAYAASGAVLLRRGSQALEKRKYDKAVRYLKQAAKKLPHWGLIHLSLAQAMRFRGDDSSAIQPHVIQAAKLLPKNPRAQFFAGQFWESQGRGGRAIKHYLQAMKLGYGSSVPCQRVARLYLAARQGRNALKCLNQMRMKGKLFMGLYALLAQARAMSGQVQLAAQDWMLAVSRQPNNLHLMHKAMLFYQRYLPQQKGEIRRSWERSMKKLRERIRRLLPKSKRRKLRMLRPSRNQQR